MNYKTGKKNIFENSEIGGVVAFGSYRFNWLGEINRDLPWIVLSDEGDRLLLVSEYLLDCVKADNTESWLDEEFINGKDGFRPYFTDGEKALIEDVFVLDASDMEAFFYDDTSRKAELTPWAIRMGCHPYLSSDRRMTGTYWTSTGGADPLLQATVNYEGQLYRYGQPRDKGDIAIRPAMWVRRGTVDYSESWDNRN